MQSSGHRRGVSSSNPSAPSPSTATPSPASLLTASSAVARAAALGVGPGIQHAATTAERARARLNSAAKPRVYTSAASSASAQRRKAFNEEKEPVRSRSRSRSPPRSGLTTLSGDDDAPTAKVAQLRLPILRAVFQPNESKQQQSSPTNHANATTGLNATSSSFVDAVAGGMDGLVDPSLIDPSIPSTIVGGPDANFHEFEKNLNLRTGEDAIEFFARMGNNSPLKFVYCLRAAPSTSTSTRSVGGREEFRPYDLQVVSRKRVHGASEYFTISTNGVVHVRAGEAAAGVGSSSTGSEFVSLDRWMHESSMFNVLRSIRFFKHYLHAKMFRLWRSNVRYRLYVKQRRSLAKRLFLARPSFAAPLLEVNRLMYEFDQIPLTQVRGGTGGTGGTGTGTGGPGSGSSGGVYLAEAFIKEQAEARSTASKKFEEKFEKLAETVERVCKGVKERARQYDHRIANDDLSNARFAQHLLGGSGKIKSMVSIKEERAERLKQLKHANLEADMLGDFIRLIDYIQVEHLVQRSISTTVQFLYMLLQSNKALFQTTVSFAMPGQGNAHGLKFNPTARDIQHIVASMHEQCVSTVDTVDRILHHPKFKPFVSPLLTDSPKIARLIGHDRTYQLARGSISEKILHDFRTVEWSVAFLEKHRPVFEFGLSWNLESYANGRQHTVESIQRDMLQQSDWHVNIRKVRDLYDAGIFEANTKELKSKLTPVTETALAGMKELLLNIFHHSCLELAEIYATKMKQLEEDPGTLPSFAEYVETFTAIKIEGVSLLDRSKKVESMHRLMREYEMQVPPADEVAFDDLQASVTNFDQALLAAEAKVDEKMPAMKQTVYKNIARLNNELESTKSSLNEGIFIDASANPKEVLKELDRVSATLSEIAKQTKTLQGYQVLFEKNEPYPFAALPATWEVYEKKRSLWELYGGWLEKSRKWLSEDFLTIDVVEMDRQVSETYAQAVKFNKEMRDSAVTMKVKGMVQEFKSLMPMLLELGNKAVKSQHWRQIFTSIGAGYYPNQDKIRIKNLKKLNVFAHRQLISDICEQAVGEHALQTSLANIQKGWATQEFTLSPYQKSKEIMILGDVEPVLTLLEENQSTLSSLLSSPYIQAVAAEVDLWDKKLSFLAEVLDEWLICQRNWQYLSPIFSSQDIQRQLPLESKMFAEVDRFWKEMMRRVANNLNVMSHTTHPQILAHFIKANKELDRIQKHLEEYLSTKRDAFPRFYFLSNDELLAILSKTKEPQAVQPHLSKCFDNIASLQFTEVPNSIEVVGMVSGEGEKVSFTKPIFTKGNTESWLLDVEGMMRTTVRHLIYRCLKDYPVSTDPSATVDRSEWLNHWPSQPVLVVDQIMWTHGVAHALQRMENGEDADALRSFLQSSKSAIASMVHMVRGPLSKQVRQMLSSLIILDVHARDVVEKMVDQTIFTQDDFEWQKQIRHYWESTLDPALAAEMSARGSAAAAGDEDDVVPEGEECILRQTNATFDYRYEYLGNSSRLVITPLTDRAYLTLTGALHLHYGGAPAGPAGTGKTETVKDLAKVLAVQNIVFNCSDGLSAKMMAQYFSGLAQAGAWACFDEFNRIDIEVLSVIAQQILTIQTAVSSAKTQFEFEGRLMPLDAHFGVFITMNPGYAGRTELPNNLKALFRPVAMMVPDYALIAQIILFSEGFQTATTLSKKMVQLYKLASEQLSQQNWYDFGMRAIKAVLVMAGQLKRASASASSARVESEEEETLLLIRAMRDSNIPKFLAQDAPLFKAIIRDLFPEVSVPTIDYGDLQSNIEEQLLANNMQVVPSFVTKILQLHETMIVRHGVMLVGAPMTGKTTVANTLAAALTKLSQTGQHAKDHPFYREVVQYRLNPKSVTMNTLYGAANIVGEWQDGLVPTLVRRAVADETDSSSSKSRKWVVFDGPVDAIWIENMNTVLDDNKMLCLNNGERIKLNDQMTMLFEVEDLAVASPATVSRCGMVYADTESLGWEPMLDSWSSTVQELLADRAEFCLRVLKNCLRALVEYVREECKQLIPAVDANLVRSACTLFAALVKNVKAASEADSEGGIADEDWSTVINAQLFMALIWSIGANVHDSSRSNFSSFIRAQLQVTLVPTLPLEGDVFDYVFDVQSVKWVSWAASVPKFVFDPNEAYFNILVPTAETVKYTFMLDALLSGERNVLMMGETGVGKSVIAADYLKYAATLPPASTGPNTGLSNNSNNHAENKRIFGGGSGHAYVSLTVLMSAQTSAGNLQDVLEGKMEKKRKNLLGAPIGKKVVLFVDDLNMPQREVYGASPPIELLRQTLDQGGFYNRSKLFFTRVQDLLVVGACAPPGGGRNPLTQRLTRHFHHIWQPLLSDASLRSIFSAILGGFLSHQASHWSGINVLKVAASVVDTSVDIYNSLRKHMLPTPNKAHYTYNLRDLSKVIQGVCQISRKHLPDLTALLRLWLHENARVFRDRLVDDQDRNWFNRLCAQRLAVSFDAAWDVADFQDIIFSDLAASGSGEDRDYREIENMDSLTTMLDEQMTEYNLMQSNQMQLVFFNSAIQHLTRIARILRQPRGNALLIGVGGSGRQSLTRLASFIAGYRCVSVEMTRGFGEAEWRAQLKKVLEAAGCENKPLTFLLSDAQIVKESFLEDINGLLNAGEVPNLFEADEVDQILQRVRPMAKSAGRGEGRDALWSYFVHLVRENLHVVLAFSPVGDTFRARCRRYPSLISCTTLDYFSPWSEEALHSVAERFLGDRSLQLDAIRPEISKMCVRIHSSVSAISVRFFKELRRHTYVTPTSYLSLLKLYTSMLTEQRDVVSKKILKYRTGLNKLQQSNKMVEELQKELVKLQPILKSSSEEVANLLVELERDQKEAKATAEVCARDAEQCAETTRQVQLIKDECQADLDEAMPAYEAAVRSLDTLDKNSITILKSFQNPPQPVKKTMEAVCILMGQKPDWDTAKRLLGRTDFLNMCKTYDKDHIPKKTIKALAIYIEDPQFTSEALASVSEAAVSLCMWVRAMDVYSRVMKAVTPKREALEAAETSLRQAQETLAGKKLSLQVVEARVQALQQKYRQKQQEKDELEQNIERTKVRLIRAEKLVKGLSSEEVRWSQSAETLHGDLKNLVGNILVAAGCIAYIGPYTAAYRQELIRGWVSYCSQLGLPVSSNFSLVRTLCDPLVVRKWQIVGLPADEYSTQNGVISTKGRRWPLCIDPQGQANRWIKGMGKRENLQVIKLSDPNYLKVLEQAIRFGQPVLLENVEEKTSSGAPGLDPALEPLLNKQIFRKGGQWLLRLGDTDIPYHEAFRFYITCKLPNPHFLPETFVTVLIVNFAVTRPGLEDQLLTVLCGLERADLEQKNDRLIVQISDDQSELAAIEDKILEMLSASSGNILDDEALIDTLAASKTTAVNVTQRMVDAEQTVKTINDVREEYRCVAQRASILFFTLADMARVDNMYAYSLLYFTQLYRSRIQETDKCEGQPLSARLEVLMSDLNESLYVSLCRGLFDKDKLLFAFLMASNIARASGGCSESEWSQFVRGSDGASTKSTPTNPQPNWLAQESWEQVFHAIQTFAPVTADLQDAEKAEAWHTWCNSFTPDTPSGAALPSSMSSATPFQRLLLIKLFRRDRVIAGIKEFVTTCLGARFTRPPPFDVRSAYASSNPRTPIIFVLSAGADPMSYIMKLAKEKGMDEGRFKQLSLGQGQGPIAEEMMSSGRRDGDWILLQNCHLAASFLPTLDRILEQASSEEVHDDFRLILTSMPTDAFPVPILHNSIKITNEPPKGLVNNLMRTFLDMSEEEYEGCGKPAAFKKLMFGLAFFHAVVQERRRFGAIGFNNTIDFSASDLEISQKQLRQYLDQPTSIPFATLTEIIGSVNYAGRVTDDKDQRCVSSLLARCLSPSILDDGYTLSDSGVYVAPPATTSLKEVREYIQSLPDDTPDAFGLHENADITFQLSETQRLVDTLVSIQPRVVGGGSGSGGQEKGPDTIVLDVALSIESRLPSSLDRSSAASSTFDDLAGSNTLGVFLSQEVDRFNKLLAVMRASLTELQRAMKGQVVMSGELEGMYAALLYNQVPPAWASAAYPSLKPLAGWVDDLLARLQFIRTWMENGTPTGGAYWLSAFFFPQGFLTAVLQRYARQTRIPIDTLKFHTHVQRHRTPSDLTAEDLPQKGALVYGLHLQGGSFDVDSGGQGQLVESPPGELFTPLPMVHLDPVTTEEPPKEGVYDCPVYKTSRRAGTLSTTGHSTNFVLFMQLPTAANPDHWIRRGAALLLQLD